ncbi:condensation domain-containing protein [Streptomyces sp. NPDC059070]|uniref:condensation domain-containing protein n=1 Tax=Streptomyces sp. NPDC059070 TaxID=3346713 RepID=UPI00369DBE86
MAHFPQATPNDPTVVRSGPLTWVQQWHWFERTIPPSRRVNPTPLADHCQVPPAATLDDIHAALTSLTHHHEALRTTIDALHPVQHVHRTGWAPLPFDQVEVPAVDARTLEAATAALAACPIDPERHPPWRARVLLEAGKPRAVLMAAHHVVIDGWGLAVLLGQLHGRLCGGALPARAPLHLLDTVDTQPSQRARAAEREWLTRLETNPTCVLAPFGGSHGGEGRHRLQHRSVAAYQHLDRVARRYRASAETVVLAALAHDVASRTGEHRFLASAVVSNRARAALRDSVGVQALTVPVQIALRPQAPFGDVVASVATACAAAYRHGRWRPAELVAAQARMDRRRGVVTVPTIEYNCYSWPREYLVQHTSLDASATWISSTPDEPCETLYVDLGLDEGAVTLDVTVGDHLLTADQAMALPVRLCALLRALAEGADCPLPKHPSTPPAPGWWRTSRGWAHLPDVEDVLRAHPGVLDVTVRPSTGATEDDEPHLVAHTRVASGVTPDDLHRHVLDQLGEVPGLIAPDRYDLSSADPPPDRTPTTHRAPSRLPDAGAERALADAVATLRSSDLAADPLGRPGAVDMQRSLADHGLTLVAVPRLLALLRRSGLTGIASDELAGTASLGHLAAALEPLSPRAHHGGETPR